MPKVSVIIPHRNMNEYLPQALLSVRQQSKPPHEVIVVDNASTVTPEAPRCLLVRHGTDLGLAASLNDGYRVATGDYCCFLGADDGWERGWLEMACKAMRRPGVDFVNPCLGELTADILEHNTLHIGALFCRETVLALGGYSASPFDAICDWEMWCRFYRFGVKGTSLAGSFYHWNRHPGTLSDTVEGNPEFGKWQAVLKARYA